VILLAPGTRTSTRKILLVVLQVPGLIILLVDYLSISLARIFFLDDTVMVYRGSRYIGNKAIALQQCFNSSLDTLYEETSHALSMRPTQTSICAI
jgi:hypothetical protein